MAQGAPSSLPIQYGIPRLVDSHLEVIDAPNSTKDNNDLAVLRCYDRKTRRYVVVKAFNSLSKGAEEFWEEALTNLILSDSRWTLRASRVVRDSEVLAPLYDANGFPQMY